MNKLILDLIDKTPYGHFIKYCTTSAIPLYGAIIMPTKIYNWYVNASVSDSINYKMKIREDSYIKIKLTKINNKGINHAEFGFNNNILSIPDNKFIKSSKAFNFQAFIDIKILDGNGRLISHNYRFLNNYDTRTKAIYFIDKFASRFAMLYKKWFINDIIMHNVLDVAFELFHSDVLYEHQYIFRNKNDNGTTIYTFSIISVEKG